MPRNRNRGLINNFEFPPEFLKSLPPPDKVEILEKSSQLQNSLAFEELQASECTKYGSGKIGDIPSSSDYDNISEFDIVSFGRSSTSSISWNDDFDAEGTLRVKTELERLDRILQGKEAIPPHYNRDEYEQWMKTFSYLSIFENTDTSLVHDKPLCYDRDSPSSLSKKIINGVHFAVIDDPLDKMSAKIHNRKANKGPEYPKQLNRIQTDQFTKRFDSILRISPVLLQEPINRSFYLDTRQQSSHLLYKSVKSASKWMREEHQDYTSLPYLTTMDGSKSKPSKTLVNKAYNSGKLKGSSKTNKSYVSLPPIKTISIPSAAQYRSVSATPRKVSNEPSVVSAHIDSLKRRRKITYNHLDSIHDIINYPK